MNKKHIALYSVTLIALICPFAYAQPQFNAWIGWPFINALSAPDDAVITAHNQQGDIVSGSVTYPTGTGIFIVPVDMAVSTEFVHFKIDNMVTDQQPQQMNVYNGNNCSSFYPLGCDENVHYLNLTVTDYDNDGYSVGYPGYTGLDKDCNDSNPEINPGMVEIPCNGRDGDCRPETYDSFDGDAESVKMEGVDNLTITINGSTDFSEIYSGNQTVVFSDSNGSFIEFLFDFSAVALNLSGVSITKNGNAGVGSIVIENLDLNGSTKTVYIDNLNNVTSLCIKDIPGIASVSEITGLCNADDEVLLPCDGSSGQYNCIIVGDRFMVTGLEHSGVQQQTYCGDGTCNSGETCSNCAADCGTCPSPPAPTGGGGGGGGYTCAEDWSCTDWSACSPEGMQTRTCEDLNGCGSSIGKPAEEQDCTYMPPQVCNNNGDCGPGETPENCPNDCKSQICTPGIKVCAGDDLMQCSSDGMEWGILETCAHGCSGEECNLPSEEEEGNETSTSSGPSASPTWGITGLIVSNPIPFSIIIIIIVATACYGIYRRKPIK